MLDAHKTLQIIEKLKDVHVVCVGDLILDIFVYGSVGRISPEAPVPVLMEKRRSTTLGGAGNVVRNLSAMGAQCTYVGVLGKDKAGDQFKELSQDLPGVTAALIESDLRPTTQKIRYLSQSGAHVLRVDREHTNQVSPENSKRIIEATKASLTPNSALILSDYDKGVLTPDILSTLITYARKEGIFVAVDPKGSDYSIYKGADLITPNLKEISQAYGKPISTDEDIVEAGRHMIQDHHLEALLITRSEKGVSLISKDQPPVHIPTKAREVFDVSGAGDTVISMLTAAAQTDTPLAQAADFANTAAGVVVGKVGTAVVTPEEIETISHSSGPHESLVLSLDKAVDQITLWHRHGLKVGFTNGCFDILHPGHIKILKESRATCDRLVVGLNSDASVKRLKGESRPVNDQESRAEVLAALESVDMVVIFGEDTPKELIEALRPDVLVKGADYTIDQVVGAQFVQSYGGEVKLIDLVPGQSTTGTISRMR